MTVCKFKEHEVWRRGDAALVCGPSELTLGCFEQGVCSIVLGTEHIGKVHVLDRERGVPGPIHAWFGLRAGCRLGFISRDWCHDRKVHYRFNDLDGLGEAILSAMRERGMLPADDAGKGDGS